jgi:Leucine-rich repeat (LRR) protein
MKYKIVFIVVISLLLGGCSLLNKSQQSNVTPEKSVTTGQTEPVKNTPPTTGEVASKNILDLSNQSLTKIPSDVFSKTNLQELNVSGNQLTGAIQGEIRFLQNLVVLNASNNQMTGVPAEIGQLEKLEVLDLSNNQLTGLPYELGNLKNLKILNISGNNYSELDLGIIKEKLPTSVKIIK